jgi:CDP-6-deoxy-D-xylo-4-hexulose-3-dehydrase
MEDVDDMSIPKGMRRDPLAPPEDRGENAERLRGEILDLVREYHAAAHPPREFVPDETPLVYAGRVFDDEEMVKLVDASLDFWLTGGRYVDAFEKRFARWFGRRHASLTNSGSSANLLALSALTSPQLGERALRPGDEVITVAAGFPTTVNPIIQNRLVPVFVDVHVPTYNVDVTQLRAALSPKSKAVMIAHTLGNPFDVGAVTEFCTRHDLWLVEDCCDALGSRYDDRQVGTFGDLATVSFYPAHHMTMGEGGCVLADSGRLKLLTESFRDWGRDCWCDPGKADTCGKRFGHQRGDLPFGYDHKYIYSHVGYNLKVTDMQAAIGYAQLDKVDEFCAARRRNFAALHEGLRDLRDELILPEATPRSDPSWFGFPIGLREGAGLVRRDVVRYLEERKIATRQVFAGNLVRQPAYADIEHRRIGHLANSDYVMNEVFWIGVYPGLEAPQIAYTVDVLHDAVATLR